MASFLPAAPSQPAAGRKRLVMPLLKLRIWVAEHLHVNELQATLVWAGVIGFFGAVCSVGFRKLVNGVHWIFTQRWLPDVETFSQLPDWQRVAVPATGGLVAGLILLLGARLNRRKSSTDYMEAIVLGSGYISSRSSFVKVASALFSIASGGSIGREGPLVQLSAVTASLIGRWGGMSTQRLRLLVACGAAAGIASAYNAPIAGALFVAEVVLGSLAMESFGPLVVASVVATQTVQQFLGENPLYEISIPTVRLHNNWEIIPHLLLGVAAGVLGPWFLRGLRESEKLFGFLPGPVWIRLTLGGLIVGALAVVRPEVCGNGYSVVNRLLAGDWMWQTVLLVLALKLLATAATFGSGAVGGVFTPTLFAGASLGYLYGVGVQHLWPGTVAPVLSVFTLVGMGAFLAATTHAPIMAIIMLFELTRDYQIISPLMLACVVAHYISQAIEPNSIYSESLRRKGADFVQKQLASLRVADLMKKDAATVRETSQFTEIAESFLTNRFNYLYVTDAQKGFQGAISLHDIKSYLSDPELADVIIARDILRGEFPTVAPDESLTDALATFSRHDGERLPVTTTLKDRTLLGSISKTDVLLALADQSRSNPAEKEEGKRQKAEGKR